MTERTLELADVGGVDLPLVRVSRDIGLSRAKLYLDPPEVEQLLPFEVSEGGLDLMGSAVFGHGAGDEAVYLEPFEQPAGGYGCACDDGH
jgi:hypothetical protein